MSRPNTAIADVPAALVEAVDRDARRRLVAGSPADGADGIDFVEVVPPQLLRALSIAEPGGRRTLLAHLIHGPVPGFWDVRRVRVAGGGSADLGGHPLIVEWAHPADVVAGTPADPDAPLPLGVTPDDQTLIRSAVAPERRGRVFVIRTESGGDLSDYLLRIVADGEGGLPSELDAPLAQDRFSFRVDCPDALDCLATPELAAPWRPQPVLDYLARDYPALRARLLDRLTALLPGWVDRHPADIAVALVELMAYLGDRWAYAQDAAAAEAYLTTARQRISVRRHARLLGHRMPDGCAARTWLAFATSSPESAVVPAGTGVADGAGGAASGELARTAETALDAGACVFETVSSLVVRAARNSMALHHWEDPDHVLPAGARAAFVTTPLGVDPVLRAGEIVILAELAPGGDRDAQHGDPARRYAVRLERDAVAVPDPYAEVAVWEIRWHAGDALPGPLRVSDRASDGRPITRAVALGNVVLADQGATVRREVLPQLSDGGGVADGRDTKPYRVRLARTGVAQVDTVSALSADASAAAALIPHADRARAAVELDDGLRLWRARHDLLASSATDAHFVVEVDDAGGALLRFGDGQQGRRPSVDGRFWATYRVGVGAAGNVASGVLTEVLSDGRDVPSDERVVPGVLSVWNPLPGGGGVDPEPIDTAREIAPHAFRSQLRAVTLDDHAALAGQVPGVQRAASRRRWNGSWPVIETALDLTAGSASDARPWTDAERQLEVRRMAGVDVAVTRAVDAPMLIAITVCVLPSAVGPHVLAALRDVLSAGSMPDGRRGLFHPDRFTFGQPVLLSDVVGEAMAVPGVAWVDVTRFGRLDDTAEASAANLATGTVPVGAQEIVRCDSDPSLPGHGRVEIMIGGGS